MAWTTPRTWTAGETPTATIFNTHLRDNLKQLSEPWQAWTPTWTANTTNPTIGNGTIVGGYMDVGKWIRFWIAITMGSTTTYGTGQWRLSLPVAQRTTDVPRWSFLGHTFDSSATDHFPIVGITDTASLMRLREWGTASGSMTEVNGAGTGPFAWATSDTLTVHGQYEAA